MNIYLITRDDDVGYDEYDAFVVAADTEGGARMLCAMEAADETKEPWESQLTSHYDIIGTTDKYTEPTIILGSFNAG